MVMELAGREISFSAANQAHVCAHFDLVVEPVATHISERVRSEWSRWFVVPDNSAWVLDPPTKRGRRRGTALHLQ